MRVGSWVSKIDDPRMIADNVGKIVQKHAAGPFQCFVVRWAGGWENNYPPFDSVVRRPMPSKRKHKGKSGR